MAKKAEKHTRARDLGVPFTGRTGKWNSITDVKGIEVGYTTIVDEAVGSGGKLRAVRTGVTAILPRGRRNPDPVYGGWFPLNGNGEMTGTAWVEESGFLEGPVMITNTHSVGVVRDAVIEWQVRNKALFQQFSMPVVAETCDAFLNDMNGFHVTKQHAMDALESARTGPLVEGNVGGGTGMLCYYFKGGTGTSSRLLSKAEGGYTVGVLVQANFGTREQCTIAGVPVGTEITGHTPDARLSDREDESGSIIIVVATDAPLLPHQLKRLARRAALGMARTGGMGGNGSGDIFIAFSTANGGAARPKGSVASVESIPNDAITPIFNATVLATEEAIVNAMVAAETMTGFIGHKAHAIPHDELRAVLAKYRRKKK